LKPLEDILLELLREGDFVALPDIGTLIAGRMPGKLDRVRSLLFPARKELSFNPTLVRNDGLLADAIARKMDINLPEAQLRWNEFKREIDHQISNSGRCYLKGIGTLFHQEQSYSFTADEMGENLLKDSFGLQPIFISPVISKISIPEHKISIPPQSSRIAWGKIAAAVILFPLSIYVFWLFTSTELGSPSGNFYISDLNPFTEKICPKYKPILYETPDISYFDNAEGLLPVDTSEVVRITFRKDIDPLATGIWVKLRNAFAVADTTRVEMNVKELLPKERMPGSFHIVMGCFSVPENAEKYIETLRAKGYDAILLDTFKTLYRVAVTGFATREIALLELEKIKSGEQPGAWLVRK
jgi:hypothetical protein